jgi:hypothetical protein
MKIKFPKTLAVIILASILGVTMACNLPSLTQFIDRDEIGSIIDEAITVFDEADTNIDADFPASPPMEPETTVHLTPAEDIHCNLFVAPNGDDSNTGNENQPWASFQYAADNAQPGDTVCFRGGMYSTEDTSLYISGTSEALITFAAYPGERPVLDGGGSANELLIFRGNTANIRVSGFVIQNFRIWGIFLSGENHHIILDHLEIIDGEAGIHFTYGESSESPPAEGPVEFITLADSVIHGSQYVAVDCTPGPCNYMTISRVEIFGAGIIGESSYGADGLEFARGHHVVVEDSYIHDNGGDGIDLGSRDREGHMQGVIVRRNRVARNRCNGIKVWAGGRIENNAIWGSGDSAIWAGTWHSTVEIINNTVAYNMWDRSYALRNWSVVVGYPEELAKPEVNLTMVNNIFAFNTDPLEGGATGIYLGAGVKMVEHHNVYFSSVDGEITAFSKTGQERWFSRQEIGDGTWLAFLGQGTGSLVLDPQFIFGWPDVDLQLRPSSPAINAGAPELAPDVDILSNPRDDQPDIGAYEY